MRIRKTIDLLGGVMLLTGLVAACGAETSTPDALTTTSTAVVEPSATVPRTPTPTSTATATATPAATKTPTPIPTPFTGGPDNFPANVNPLTGLTVADPTLLDRNPVMVKVSNFPRGLRPHSGLSWADIVFEQYMGVGGTRFDALYYGQNPPEAGPVRSARLIDAQLADMFNALLAFSSADPFVYDRVVTALGLYAINEGLSTCPALCRTGTGDVNSVRAYPELLTEFAEEERDIIPEKPDLTGTTFDPIAPEGGASGQSVTVFYSTSTISEWQFDETSGLYNRYIESVDEAGTLSIIPLVDALTGDQLTAANVIILFVETIEIKPTLHDFTLAENRAGQRALLFRNGQVYEIVWDARGPGLVWQYFGPDGELFPLNPGNSWVHIVGLSSPAREDSPGVWTVTNFLP